MLLQGFEITKLIGWTPERLASHLLTETLELFANPLGGGLEGFLPLPNDRELSELIHQTGVITPQTSGMTFGHGIWLKDGAHNRQLITHELVHVLQYERLGGIEPTFETFGGKLEVRKSTIPAIHSGASFPNLVSNQPEN